MSDPISPPPAPGSNDLVPTVTVHDDPFSDNDLTPSQAATMAEWAREDLAKGKITQAQADKIFTDLNTPPELRAPDTRTDEQKTLDHHFPAAKESEYLIQYYPPGQEPPVMPKEMQAFDTNARTWLAGAEFPRELGNSLVNAIAKTAQQTHHMTADELEMYGYSEFEKLVQAYRGEDILQEKLRAAAVMIDALDKKQPGLKNLLQSKGIGDNALVASLIIQQAERWHARRP